jgi:hypothetical protein
MSGTKLAPEQVIYCDTSETAALRKEVKYNYADLTSPADITEARLAAGWIEDAVKGERTFRPSDTHPGREGYEPATGGAGRWRLHGYVSGPESGYTLWTRWLVPVEGGAE